jgi:hypothetical protein
VTLHDDNDADGFDRLSPETTTVAVPRSTAVKPAMAARPPTQPRLAVPSLPAGDVDTSGPRPRSPTQPGMRLDGIAGLPGQPLSTERTGAPPRSPTQPGMRLDGIAGLPGQPLSTERTGVPPRSPTQPGMRLDGIAGPPPLTMPPALDESSGLRRPAPPPPPPSPALRAPSPTSLDPLVPPPRPPSPPLASLDPAVLPPRRRTGLNEIPAAAVAALSPPSSTLDSAPAPPRRRTGMIDLDPAVPPASPPSTAAPPPSSPLATSGAIPRAGASALDPPWSPSLGEGSGSSPRSRGPLIDLDPALPPAGGSLSSGEPSGSRPRPKTGAFALDPALPPSASPHSSTPPASARPKTAPRASQSGRGRLFAVVAAVVTLGVVGSDGPLDVEELQAVGRAWRERTAADGIDDQGVVSAVGVVGDSVGGSRPRPAAAQRVRVLRGRDSRAFAVVDGGTVVTAGMLGLLTSEAELAALLAHVQAHHDLGHVEQAVAAGVDPSDVRAALARPTAAEAALRAAVVEEGVAYSPIEEMAADAAALAALRAAGWDPRALRTVVERIAASAEPEAVRWTGRHALTDERRTAWAAGETGDSPAAVRLGGARVNAAEYEMRVLHRLFPDRRRPPPRPLPAPAPSRATREDLQRWSRAHLPSPG